MVPPIAGYPCPLRTRPVKHTVSGSCRPRERALILSLVNSVGILDLVTRTGTAVLELPRYDGHLSIWANQGGVPWRGNSSRAPNSLMVHGVGLGSFGSYSRSGAVVPSLGQGRHTGGGPAMIN